MGFNMEYDCKKITEKLTNILNEKVDKDIDAIVWLKVALNLKLLIQDITLKQQYAVGF